MANLPKLQHYVPQFLLRQFATGKKRQVHVLDKRDDKVFVAPVNKVGAQRGFYNVPPEITQQVLERVRADGIDTQIEGVVLSLEPSLGTVENRAAAVVRRIVREESLGGLTDEDRLNLAFFATVQYLRVPRQRDLYRQFTDVMRTKVGALIEGMGRDVDIELARAGLAPASEDDHAHLHLRTIVDASEFLPYFLEKTWLLHRGPAAHSLYIGDNPVTLWNHGPRGESLVRGFGLGTLKSEIALPLSPRLCLVMLCPSILEETRMTLAGVDKPRAAWLWPGGRMDAGLRQLVEASDTGMPIDINVDSVTHFNSRQVRMASRFVYASDGRFTLARQMLTEHPEMRSSPRIVAD